MGSGYTASRSVLRDGSAWLTRGRGIVHVNGVTGRPDAEVARDLAKGDEHVQVVQTPGGNVYVVNGVTNEVNRIDLARMDVDRGGHVGGAGPPGDLELLAAGGHAYLVHRQEGRVETVDPLNLAVRGSVTVQGGIQGAVIDDTGAVWTVSGQGRAQRIRGTRVEAEAEVAEPGAELGAALVGRAPVVADLAAGTVRRLDPEDANPEEPVALPGEAGVVMLNGPGNPGPWLWAARADGSLVRVDFDRRTVALVELGRPGGSLGPPVVSGGRVHVPDYAHHVVISVDGAELKVSSVVPVPGTSSRFDAFVKDGAIWVNDPTGPRALVIDAEGRSKEVDKGGRPSNQVPPLPVPATTTARPLVPQRTPPERTPPAPIAEKKPAAPPPLRPPPAPGDGTTVVPGVVGQPQAQACSVLAQAGFSCQLVDRGRGRPVGTVVEQSPGPGARATKGSAVAVHVFGAKPQVAVPAVPDDPKQACATLQASGLQCALTDQGRGGPVNKVTETVPAKGSMVEEGTSVQVHYYSSPPPPTRLASASSVPAGTPRSKSTEKTASVNFGGFRVVLASSSNGSGEVSVDDAIDIVVTRADGTTRSYSHDYSHGCKGRIFPTPPKDLTGLFAEGSNSVRVTLRDICGTFMGSSDLWLVYD